MLRTHRQAWIRLIDGEDASIERSKIARVGIVGGGLFPRTAILLRELLPDAELTLIDASAANLETAREPLGTAVLYQAAWFDARRHHDFDLLVFPLAYRGDDKAKLRERLPAPRVVFHDWAWECHGRSVMVSPWLLKRMSLHLRSG